MKIGQTKIVGIPFNNIWPWPDPTITLIRKIHAEPRHRWTPRLGIAWGIAFGMPEAHKRNGKIGIKQHPYEISHCIPSCANIHEEIAFQDIARYHFGSSLYSFPWLKSFKTKECWHEELFINPPLACLPYHEILAWQTRQHDVSPSFMLNPKNQNQQ